MAQKEQLAVSYAAFVLSAQGAAITAESINAVLAAAKVTASATLVSAVAKSLSGRNINEFFGSVGGGSSAPAPAEKPAPKQAAKPAEKPAAKPKQQPKPAEEEEMDMGGLFD